MLYLLFTLIMLLPLFAGFGGAVQRIFGKPMIGLSGTVLAGMVSVSVICTFAAFLIPLNIYFETALLTVGFCAFFYYKIYNELGIFLKGIPCLFYILVAVVLFFGSGFPFVLDHFGYYVPTIKWISEVGLVQGLANLDLLLGQMSVWHILQAGISHFSDPFLRLNAVVLIVYLIYIFENRSWIHLVFLPVLFFFVQSPSPDLPAIAVSMIVLDEILRRGNSYGWLFALSVFVFAIKPTMIWVPVFTLLHLIYIRKTNIKIFVPGLAMMFLFLFKNIWVFGFPIFPVTWFDLGLAWKPNADLLQTSADMAVQKTFDMQYSVAQIKEFSTSDYIHNWLFLDGIKGKINMAFVASLFALLAFAFRKNSTTVWFLFAAILFKSVLVLLFSAQYRFFLDVFFVVFFIIFYKIFSHKLSLTVFTVLSLVVGVFLSFPVLIKSVFPTFRLGSFVTGISKDQWYQPAYFELKKYKTHQIGNLRFNAVENYPFSFDTPLPTISPGFIQEDLDAGIFPQLKGKTLNEGFIWREISAEEKIKLQQIVDEFNLSQ